MTLDGVSVTERGRVLQSEGSACAKVLWLVQSGAAGKPPGSAAEKQVCR
jgi:hypothetical protein